MSDTVKIMATTDDVTAGLATKGAGDALTTGTLDQFANVTQTAGKTLAITDNTTLSGGTHSGTNTGDQLRAVTCIPTNYVSMTGTAGADNTAQAVKTIALAAGTMHALGDRLRVRAYWKGDTGAAITATLTLNGVSISTATDGGAASFFVNEAWLHYGDATHANVIAMSGGTIDAALSNNNVAGFDWANAQNITVSQDAIAGNHIIVYFLAADYFPIGA